MDDLVRHARLILRGMWLHRRLAVAVAWVVGVLVGGFIFMMPDKYEASSRIFVDTDSVLGPLLQGLAIQPNTEQQVAVLSRTLISRPNVEKLVRMADLDLNVTQKSDRDDLVDSLMKKLSIKSTGRDNLFTLSYMDANPAKATKVVQSLTTIFVESGLGDKRQDADSAKRFLDDQIKSYEQKLGEAEQRLKEFKLKNIDMALGQNDGGVIGQISDLSSKLSQARLQLREAENSRDAIRKQILGEGKAGTDGALVSVPEVDARIDAVKRNLDTLLQKYTDQHPDVVGARRLIKDLEDQKRQEVAALRKAAEGNPGAAFNGSPLYQQLKISMAEAEANVATLRTRVGEYEARYNRYKDDMRLRPEIEAEYSQLNRDYDIHKKNYESLVARRESATISGDVDSAGAGAIFKVIDPPRASNTPAAPNRLLLLPGAFLVSVLAGCAVAFVAYQVRPTFSDARIMRDVLGLPVLGTVTLIVSPEMKAAARKSLLRVGAALGGLVGFYALGMVVLTIMAPRAG